MTQKKKLRDINMNLMFSKIMPSYKSYTPDGSCSQGSAEQNSDSPRYINLNEIIIISCTPRIMETLRCCSCSKCRQTVILDALNHTKSNYVYDTPAKALKSAALKPDQDILDTVISAALALKEAHPDGHQTDTSR